MMKNGIESVQDHTGICLYILHRLQNKSRKESPPPGWKNKHFLIKKVS